MLDRVIIEHENGLAYSVPLVEWDRLKVDGDKTYKDLGFKILRWDDGTEYEPPKAAKGPK